MPKKWRKGEFATCGFKNRYPSRTAADRRIAMFRSCGDDEIESYKCPFCFKWHVGHPNKRKEATR